MEYRRAPRAPLALVFALALTLLAGQSPAQAGTFTSASFTAPTAYTYTSSQNTRYDWGFTTASTATLSKVTMSVPAGTGGANRYLTLNGAASNDARTPDSVANSITGDIDIRLKVALRSWTPAAPVTLISKQQTGTTRAYRVFVMSTGKIELDWSTDGSGNITRQSNVLGFADGSTNWLRVTLAVNSAGNNVTTFYTSADGTAWSQFGSPVSTAGATSIFDSVSPVAIGTNFGGNGVDGKVFHTEVRNGINGTVVNKFDPNDATATQAVAGSWTSTTGETWTVNRSGTNLPADIATDLDVGPVTGLPSGGTANYRFIDGVATYNLPVATNVSAGTSSAINLGNFINTATAGNYASTIKSWDNSATPAQVDTVTTSSLAFSADTQVANVQTQIDPTLTFAVSGSASACGGATPSAGTSSSGTSVNLGHVTAASNAIAAQLFTITSNAGNQTFIYGRCSGPLNDGAGHTIANVTGADWSHASAWPAVGTPAFGFRMGWYSGSDTWVRFYTTNHDDFWNTGAGANHTQCIAYRAQSSSTTAAGTYSATITFTAVPFY